MEIIWVGKTCALWREAGFRLILCTLVECMLNALLFSPSPGTSNPFHPPSYKHSLNNYYVKILYVLNVQQ